MGFINKKYKFESYVFEESVTLEVVIASVDAFIENITKKTIALIDNTSMHTSHKFKENIAKWEAKSLYIHHIPAYSPELNKI